MSFDTLMRHTFIPERREAVYVDGEPQLDEDGHTVTETVEGEPFRGTAQLKQARELALASQAGTVLYDYDLFTRKRDLTSLDDIWHDPSRCNASNDLGSVHYQVRFGHDDADRGHHHKYDARITSSEPFPEGS